MDIVSLVAAAQTATPENIEKAIEKFGSSKDPDQLLTKIQILEEFRISSTTIHRAGIPRANRRGALALYRRRDVEAFVFGDFQNGGPKK